MKQRLRRKSRKRFSIVGPCCWGPTLLLGTNCVRMQQQVQHVNIGQRITATRRWFPFVVAPFPILLRSYCSLANNVSVLHQNEGSVRKSIRLRDFPRPSGKGEAQQGTEGMEETDFPIPGLCGVQTSSILLVATGSGSENPSREGWTLDSAQHC